MADDDAKARRTTKARAGGPARKAVAKKATGAVDPVKKATVKKATVKKATVKKAAVKKAAVKKAAVKKAAPAPRAAASKAAPKKAATARKAPAKRSGGRDAGAVLAPRKKAPPPLRLAAEQTFDDDAWREPEPEPVREDPGARVRGILRAAALSLEAKETGTAPVTPPAAPPPAPPRPDEQVTRVLVSPPPADFEGDDDLTEPVPVVPVDQEEDEDEEEDDWSPPEVLDDLSPAPSTAPSPPPPAPPPPPPSDPPRPEAAQVIVPPAPAPAPEKKKSRLGLRLLLVLLVLALAAGAVFAFLAFRDDAIDYSELKVGDCFDSTQSNEVRGINVKPCSEPHNSEIFFLVQHPAGPDEPYPGRDALVQFAADACLGQPLTDYLGVPLEQSSLKDFEIVPQQSAWEDGRRVLVCGLDTGGGEKITGSVKGTRR